MKTLLILFHSRTDGTRQMAEAVRAGAADEAGVRVRLLGAENATGADVLAAEGCIFAAPENLAALSGVMKDFFDRAYYDVLERVNGRPYAALICAGSDGEGAARQIARIALGWRMRPVAPPLIVHTGAQSPAAIWTRKTIPDVELSRCRTLGTVMAAGLADGIF